MAKFKTIITTAGAAKIAAVLAGTGSIVLDKTAKMAIGDGGGTLPTPVPSQTKLVNEVHRAPLNNASIDAHDPKNIVVELIIPPETGGFWMREMALYDAAGTLLAVGNMAEAYKPNLSEGAGRKLVIRMVIAVSEVTAITITMDASTVMATKDYVDDKIDEHAKSRNHPDATLTAKGFTQLNSTTNSPSETQAATPKAVKTVMDATNLKAPLASPVLTGTPTAPTAATDTNTQQLATTAFVRAAITALINSSPGVLDTLGELAAALGNDANFSATMTSALAAKAPLASPALTGVPTAPTAEKTVNTTQLATAAFVKAVVADYALSVSPALTGTPTAPTAAQTVNNTQLATTAFVKAAVAALVDSSPGALDTLNELAAALGDDPNFATTMTNALAGKQPLNVILTALAAQKPAANKLPYFTAADSFGLTDLSVFIRTMLGKADAAAVLAYLGLGKTDSPTFGGLTAQNITLRPGKVSLLSSTDGTTIAITVNGESVAEIKAESIFHKRALIAGEFLQAPKLTFRDGDINFYSGQKNLVMQVGGNDVATLTPENFYHVKQVVAAESLKAPALIFRDNANISSSVDGKTLVATVNSLPILELTSAHLYHGETISAGKALTAPSVEASTSIKSPKYIFRDGDINFYSGPKNLVMQVGGNDAATLTPDSFFHVKQVSASESLKAPKVILRDGDVNLIGGANNLVIQVGGNDIASLTPGNNFFKGKLTAETSMQVGSTCMLAADGNLTGSKWGGWLDTFMKDGMSTDGNGLWWDAFSSQLQFRIGDWSIPTAAGGAVTSVTFPKSFVNGCLIVIPVPSSGGASEQIGCQSYTKANAIIQKGASDTSPRSGKYLAIGY